MSKKLEYEGICSTCKSAPVCIFRKDASRPIMQCAEFEGLPPARMMVGAIEMTRPGKSPSTDSCLGTSESCHKGLCMNCKNLEHCTFPKPDGGVWRCDEYE